MIMLKILLNMKWEITYWTNIQARAVLYTFIWKTFIRVRTHHVNIICTPENEKLSRRKLICHLQVNLKNFGKLIYFHFLFRIFFYEFQVNNKIWKTNALTIKLYTRCGRIGKKNSPFGTGKFYSFFFHFNNKKYSAQNFSNLYVYIQYVCTSKKMRKKNCYYNLFDCQLLKRKNAKPHEFKMTFPHNKSGFILFWTRTLDIARVTWSFFFPYNTGSYTQLLWHFASVEEIKKI